jgi:hypothetical protein
MRPRLRFVAHALGAIAAGLTTGLAIVSRSWDIGLIAVALTLALAISRLLEMLSSKEVA